MVLDQGINSRDAPPDPTNLLLLCDCFSDSLQRIPRDLLRHDGLNRIWPPSSLSINYECLDPA